VAVDLAVVFHEQRDKHFCAVEEAGGIEQIEPPLVFVGVGKGLFGRLQRVEPEVCEPTADAAPCSPSPALTSFRPISAGCGLRDGAAGGVGCADLIPRHPGQHEGHTTGVGDARKHEAGTDKG